MGENLSYTELLTGDLAAGVALLVAGAHGVRTWRVLRGSRASAVYWALAGAGLIYLALDEAVGLHELLANILIFFGAPKYPPGLNHLNDAFIVAYFAGGAVISLYYIREIFAVRSFLPPFIFALAAMGVAMVADAFVPHGPAALRLEEDSEIVGALFFALAFRVQYAFAARSVLSASEVGAPIPMTGAEQSS